MLIKIVHPLADEMSVQSSPAHACTQGVSSEIAFFLRGEWVGEIIEPFADYADGGEGSDYLVYGWVPNNLIYAFIEENEDK